MLKNRTIVFLMLFATTCLASQLSYAAKQAASVELQQLQNEPLIYKGWAVIKKNVLEDNAPDKEWVSMRGIEISNDGKKVRILNGDKPTPYELELIVITYENTNTTVLKLALYEDGKDKSITYIWGQPDAERLGMNLRWMQAGFTKA